MTFPDFTRHFFSLLTETVDDMTFPDFTRHFFSLLTETVDDNSVVVLKL